MMKVECRRLWGVLAISQLAWSLASPTAHATAAASAATKAKHEAETQGYAFELRHNDIVSKAKREGRLRVITSLEDDKLKPVAEAFRKKYPFIELRAEEIGGTDTYQRMLLEMKAGAARGWDINFIAGDFYDEYLPHQKRFDILGMAQQGILQIPVGMIDPVNRNIVAYTTNTMVVAYNKNLLSDEKVPSQWEEFLKPEFNGRKFLADIRPQFTSALVPAWGLEKTLQFAKKISAQNPVWVGGHSRAIGALSTGEHGVYLGANLTGTKRFMSKDVTGALRYKIVEPIPIRIGDHEAVFEKADSPYAALLWLEFVSGPEAQKLIEAGFKGSVFSPGTTAFQVARAKKISLVDWRHYTKMQEYLRLVIEAYGFPQAEAVGKK
ncbi:MAG TPA: extracellular solute-binding protein [Candidatus Binatia bacterium]